MSIILNSSCQLIDNKYVIVDKKYVMVNGIEYMRYWLLENFDFIES